MNHPGSEEETGGAEAALQTQMRRICTIAAIRGRRPRIPAMACIRVMFIIGTAMLLAACSDRAEHVVAVPWALGGQWLVGDFHTHTRFSDGSATAEEVVQKAITGGCHALAITDHGDRSLKSSVTAEYIQEIRRLRQQYRPLALIAGMEWNVPPHGGREHATVLAPPSFEEALLPEFRRRFEQEGASAEEALRWLHAQAKQPGDAVLVYNHPTRMARSLERTLSDFTLWRKASTLMVGFEGAPGHQRVPPSAGQEYRGIMRPEHRWDPVAASVGGVWDTLLDRGESVWAALASSDYHNDKLDYPPCAFSRTYVQVPERSPAGVLKALHAGTYWAVHGRFLNDLLFTVSAPGLAFPASPGETIRYRRGREVRVNIAVGRSGEAGKAPLSLELIGNCGTGRPQSLATLPLEPGSSAAETSVPGLTPGADGQSCYLRLRVRRKGGDGDDWLAYTNPVRIRLD